MIFTNIAKQGGDCLDLYTVRNKIIAGVPIQDLKLKVTFYARVSTDKDEQLHSLAAQISYFKEYIEKVSNWEFINGYIDEGISGTSVNKREDFLKMINDARQSKFDLILTKEISRFSRNTLDSIKYTQELLQSGVGVYFLNDNINTIFPDSELRLTIMASVAQDEVRKLSERVHFGMKRSIDKGVVLGCSNIYGYVKDNGKLVVDEKQAEMVKFIYDNYANTSISLSSLARLMAKRGYKNTRGNPIDITIIQRIIMNPKYKGYYCGNKSQIIDYRTKLKKRLEEENWKMYKDEENVPAIITEEIWEKANRKLEKVKKGFKDRTEDTTIFQNRYTYSGKIFCGIHGTTYHRSSAGSRKDNPAWECKVYRKGGKRACNNSKLFEYELDKVFNELFKRILSDKSVVINGLLKEYEEYLNTVNVDDEILNLEKKCKVINEKKDKLLELVMEGNISNSDFSKKNEELNGELKYFDSQITILKVKKDNEKSIDERINYLKEQLGKAKDDNVCFNELFNSLVEKIAVYPVPLDEGESEKYNNKTRLEILFKTGETLYGTSNFKGSDFHLTDSHTTSYSS